MAIKVGDKIPNVKLQTIRDGSIERISTDDFFKGRKVVLFAVPGAFTSVCSDHHLPGYADRVARGAVPVVDEIVGPAGKDLGAQVELLREGDIRADAGVDRLGVVRRTGELRALDSRTGQQEEPETVALRKIRLERELIVPENQILIHPRDRGFHRPDTVEAVRRPDPQRI